MNILDINKRVMLASLRISVWRARRFDTRATEDVEKKHAAKDIGRFNKKLLTDEAVTYKRVCGVAAQARAFFDSYTLEYDQLGVRLLPADVYLTVADRTREFQDEFQRATGEFLAAYPELKTQAKVALNGLYDAGDYPADDALSGKFGMRLSLLPFPDASQFDINLPHNVLAGLKSDMDERVLNAVKTANDDLVGRLYEAVQTFANRLYGSKSIRLGVADKVRELSALLPKLNFTGDPALSSILTQAREHLACYTGAELKESEDLRNKVADKAMEIEAQMALYMTGGVSRTVTPLAQPNAMQQLLAA
ncbi:hypothetical protein ACI2UK_24365 [Ralstonia nicotianae]|uniref:hypothetical protein n=1 Tax=Ralstonia pseudosolanacearum TaxID=1310165 RepID=UPI0020068F70|nr:hypothetical protein [Ralstonia pseudosolanacearum]MCK4120423.1 hypothetical protein [Ralstonia pseudosolanacearum]